MKNKEKLIKLKEELIRSGKTRIAAGALAVTMTITLAGCSKSKEQPKNIPENKYGYIDIIPTELENRDKTDFICYHVGDYDTVGTLSEKMLNEALNKCQELELSRTIIIDSKATCEADICLDLEYAKSIVKNYTIDLPVYLNIDNIMDNESLNMDQKNKIIMDFVNKAQSNGMYVGLYGTSTHLWYLNEYGSQIDGKFDTFVIEDEIKEYNGTAYVRMDVKGNITSKYESEEDNNDLATLITKRGLNNPENFVNDAYYTFTSKDDISLIAMQNNLSVEDLLKYNRLTQEDLDTIEKIDLRIPNQVQTTTIEDIDYNYEINDSYIAKGLDISFWQPKVENIDWEKLSKTVDFLILRVSDQDYNDFEIIKEDSNFQNYYNKCMEYNIPVGVYYVTRATTVEEAELEAKLVSERLAGLNITYPVYMDFENEVGTNSEKEFQEIKNNGSLSQILTIESQIIENSGFIFGVYSNQTTFASMVEITPDNFMNNFSLWLANYNNFNYDNIQDSGPIHTVLEEEYKLGMKQVSNSVDGKELGINSEVDYNLCYVDFENGVEKIEITSPTKEFDIITLDNRINTDFSEFPSYIPYVLVGTAGFLAGGIIGHSIGSIKNKTKKRIKNIPETQSDE